MSKTYIDFAAAEKVLKAATPQSQAIPGRETEMKRNNAGGVTFTLDQWGVLDRFLVIGSEGGNYYVGERDVTKQSFDVVKKCVAADGLRTVARAVEYSTAGRAPKNDPAVVVLALAAVYGDEKTKEAAFEALPKVARTGTWLFMFVAIVDSLGKWNAATKRGVAKWYTSKTVDRLAVQLLKYQSRNGWAHRDVLRLAHVKPSSEVQSNLFRYAVKGSDGMELGMNVPQLVVDFEMLKRTDRKADVLRLIASNKDLTWEMVPTQWHKDNDVMMALLPGMGLTALIRKLALFSQNGLIAPLSEATKLIVAKLSDAEALKAQRVHPVTLLNAQKVFAAGRLLKLRPGQDQKTWKVEQRIVDALNDAFYASFGNVDKTGESYLLGVDCSGSMFGAGTVVGLDALVAAEVAGVMALAIAKHQPNYWIGGFNTRMSELKISPNMRLEQALKVIRDFSWGGTDCALPMLHAAQHKMQVDKFVTITDNETWAGSIQPVQALKKYRAAFNPAAKSVVVGTMQSEFTISDPKDAGMLDVAGFDSAVPQIIAQL